MTSRTIKILSTATIVAGALGYLLYTSVAGSAQGYEMVSDVMSEPDKHVDKTMSVAGFVEAGTIKEQLLGDGASKKLVRTFVLEHKGSRIRVKHVGAVPDTFKDNAELAAKGTIKLENGEYVLHSTDITAKCASKYKGKPEQYGTTADNSGVFSN